MANVRGVAFDLEGTLVDLESSHFLAFEHALRSCGVKMTVDEITSLEGMIGGGDPRIAETLATLHGLQAQDILMEKNTHFDTLLRERSIEARPGAIEVIKEMQRRYPIAIGSLTERARGEVILKKSGLAALFPPTHIVFREDVHEPKPHPAVYQETARRLGVSQSTQHVFEDSPAGVAAARAAGSSVIAVPVPIFQEKLYLDRLVRAGAAAILCDWNRVHTSLVQNSTLAGIA